MNKCIIEVWLRCVNFQAACFLFWIIWGVIMKKYFPLFTIALMLSACGGNETATTTASTTAVVSSSDSAAPAVVVDSLPAECKVEITSDDAMKFDKNEIAVKSTCQDFAITLKHVGKVPKAAMGHNVVITKSADKAGVIADGMAAKLENDYLPPNDNRVIAATKLIGGGETDTVVFKTDKLKNGEFDFFCSFPGHANTMTGKVKLVD